MFLEIFQPDEKDKNESSTIEFIVALIINSLLTIVVMPFYTIGMNYACEITYPVGESINGGFMISASQISGIGGTFLCDYFISNYPEKKWITNVIITGFFWFGCIFVFLFDDKLDRHEIDSNNKNI